LVRGPTEKQQSAAFTAATVCLVLVLVIGLARHGYLTPDTLKNQKDAISAASSICTALVLAIGGTASYYRFFRGRTFSVRAELSLDATIIKSPQAYLLHVVIFSVKNAGTMAIWNPVPSISVQSETPKGSTRTEIVGWLQESVGDDLPRKSVIDAGEIANFFFQHPVDPEVWAVTYIATVKSEEGDVWTTAKTLANHPSER
jgi:hypothetical protein